MTNEEAIKIIKTECYVFNPLNLDRTQMVNTALDTACKALEQEPCEDAISRQAVLDYIDKMPSELTADGRRMIRRRTLEEYISDTLPPVTPQPKTGHWSRKTKVDAYDIAGVKTWGIKCQCDKCDFTTIVVEDFGYYKYCPNCGARMAESEDKK